MIIPTLFEKIVRDNAIASVRRSVCPSPYLLLNHWTKANQIAHMNGACKATFFWPHPLGPSGGAKRSNIIKFQLQSQFQRFFNQTLCVFSRKKGIKHIRRDFHLATWVMPQGWDFGVPWGVGGCFGGSKNCFPKFNQILCVCVTYMNGTCTGAIFWAPAPWGLGEGPKGQISLNLNYKVNFKDF